MPDDDLDDVLDSVLDEFDAQQAQAVTAPPSASMPGHAAGAAALERDVNDLVAELRRANAGDTGEHAHQEEIDAVFEKMLKLLPADDKGNRSMPTNVQESLNEAARMIGESAASGPTDEDALFRKLLEDMKLGGSGDELSGDLEASMNTLMEQMVSKENLYEPIHAVAGKYPVWIADHAATLTDAELKAYESQHAVFVRLLAKFDSDGGVQAEEVFTLLNEVQAYGKPPPEIMEVLVPGIKFDDKGEPIVEGATSGMPDAECSIM